VQSPVHVPLAASHTNSHGVPVFSQTPLGLQVWGWSALHWVDPASHAMHEPAWQADGHGVPKSFQSPFSSQT
jgi:hypothetical protein